MLRHKLIPVWFMITSHQLHLSDYSFGFPIMQASRHEGEGGHPPRLHVQTTVLSYKGYPRSLCKLISMGTRLHSVHFTFNSNFCRYSVPTMMNQRRWPTLSTLPYVGGTSGSIPKLGTLGYPCGLSCTRAPQVSGLTSFTISRTSSNTSVYYWPPSKRSGRLSLKSDAHNHHGCQAECKGHSRSKLFTCCCLHNQARTHQSDVHVYTWFSSKRPQVHLWCYLGPSLPAVLIVLCLLRASAVDTTSSCRIKSGS